MDFSWIADPEQRAKAEADYAASVQALVAKEVEGLKNKNNELIEEKKSVAERLTTIMSQVDGLDLAKAKEAMDLLEKTKRKDLLEDGKLDEYIQAEVQTKARKIEAQFSSQLEVALQDNEKIAEKAGRYESLFKNKIIEDALRTVAMGSGCKIEPAIIEDIIYRGKRVFNLNADESGIEAKNADGSYKKTKDGDKILTPDAWAEDLKKECPHYFPPSQGTGASGGGSGKSGGSDDLSEKIKAALDAGNMELYRELRKKQGAKLR